MAQRARLVDLLILRGEVLGRIADYERARLLEPEDDWALAKLSYLERQD